MQGGGHCDGECVFVSNRIGYFFGLFFDSPDGGLELAAVSFSCHVVGVSMGELQIVYI